MRPRRPLNKDRVQRESEKERNAGLDPEDEAARWLAEHDPKPPAQPPKSARKSKALHQWRNRRPPN